jgi:hypothetical protein
MDRLHRESYPYQQRLSRMAFFPGLAHSGRPYEPAQEPTLWKWSRVADHLATYAVTRQVDKWGQVSIYNRGNYVGTIHKGKKVYVMFDPIRSEWLITDHDGQQLRTLPAEMLTPQRVMGLDVAYHKK